MNQTAQYDISSKYNESVRLAQDSVQKTLLSFTHDVDIRHQLRKHAGVPFAGNIVREGEQVRPGGFPAHVVPMMAPFVPPFSSDWERSFEVAVETVNESRQQDDQGNPHRFIIIPIESPGGIVDCLEKMLGCIDRVKTMEPPIEIITYAVGMVASCAFILFQSGDTAWATDCSRFLCHEPTIPRAPAQPGAAQKAAMIADVIRDAASLTALREMIYERAEVGIFRRQQRMVTKNRQVQLIGDDWLARNIKDGLIDLRTEWGRKNSTQLEQFSRHTQLQQGERLAPYNAQVNILKYITEGVAKDPHDQVISSDWMIAFGLCDAVGLNLEACRTEFVEVKKERGAINIRRFVHADQFER